MAGENGHDREILSKLDSIHDSVGECKVQIAVLNERTETHHSELTSKTDKLENRVNKVEEVATQAHTKANNNGKKTILTAGGSGAGIAAAVTALIEYIKSIGGH